MKSEEEGDRDTHTQRGEREREERDGRRTTRVTEGKGPTENSIPWSIMQPVCRITAGTRFRFAPMKGLLCVYPAWMSSYEKVHRLWNVIFQQLNVRRWDHILQALGANKAARSSLFALPNYRLVNSSESMQRFGGLNSCFRNCGRLL